MADALKPGCCRLPLFAFVYAKDYLRGQGRTSGQVPRTGLVRCARYDGHDLSQQLLTVYLGLELLALCLYALVAFNRDSDNGAEAAMKYFVLGALASGMLLYGISMVYGATGQLVLPVAAVIASGKADQTVLVFGLVFIVIGVSFKFGAVPFHMWVPDVSRRADRGDLVSRQRTQDRSVCAGNAFVGRWHGGCSHNGRTCW